MNNTTLNDQDLIDEEAFEQAFRIKEELNKQAEKPAYTYIANNNREEIPWYGLDNGVDTVIRPLGNLIEVRKHNWEAKAIYHSELATDNRKRYSDIIWKTKKNYDGMTLSVLDEDWVLYKVYNLTNKKNWDKTPFVDSTGKMRDGKYEYDYKDTDIFKLLDTNALNIGKNITLYPKKVKPQKKVILPVLVRNENSSQVRILTSKYSTKEYTDKQGNQKVQVYCDFGIPASENPMKYMYLYDLIYDKIALKYRNWHFDIVIKKSKLTNTQYQYDIYPSFSTEVSSFAQSLTKEQPKLVDYQAVDKNGKAYIAKRASSVPLTPEEQALEKPNIDLLFAETSYEKLYIFHKELFILADKTFKTNFYDELAESYKLENPKANITTANVTLPVTESYSSVLPTGTPQETVVNRRSVVNVDQAGSDLVAQCRQVFKSWDSLEQEEKDLMVETIDFFNDGVPSYKKKYLDSESIYHCSCSATYTHLSTGMASDKNVNCHLNIKNCPMCAKKL